MPRDFEWDSAKEAANIRKHGVDFTLAATIFQHPVLTVADDRQDYGEQRFVSLGITGAFCLVVVWTPRGSSIRLISAWKGGQDERDRYRAHVARGSA